MLAACSRDVRSGNRCRKCGCNVSANSYIDVAECPRKFWRNDNVLQSLRERTADGKEFTYEHLRDAIRPKTLLPKLEPLPIVENRSRSATSTDQQGLLAPGSGEIPADGYDGGLCSMSHSSSVAISPLFIDVMTRARREGEH